MLYIYIVKSIMKNNIKIKSCSIVANRVGIHIAQG